MTQGPLPLVLLAARGHPNADFRAQLWSRLDGWLAEQSPRSSKIAMEALISQERGTFLEPFRLDAEDLRIATFLARLALSEKSPVSRFRIASADTTGDAGGLVVTRSGKSFYSERYALGANHLVNSNLRYFAPSMLVVGPVASTAGGKLHATMRSDEKGLYLDVPVSVAQRVGWAQVPSELKALCSSLLKNSVIGPKLLPIASLKADVSATEAGLCLSVTASEALIRFSGHVVLGNLMWLKADNRFEIAVELPKTAEGPAPITIVASDTFARDWMDVDGLGIPPLAPVEIAEISTWAFQHAHWMS
jgi:hypothetical protein